MDNPHFAFLMVRITLCSVLRLLNINFFSVALEWIRTESRDLFTILFYRSDDGAQEWMKWDEFWSGSSITGWGWNVERSTKLTGNRPVVAQDLICTNTETQHYWLSCLLAPCRSYHWLFSHNLLKPQIIDLIKRVFCGWPSIILDLDFLRNESNRWFGER